MFDTTQHISEVHNEDCMIGMARYPDKWFDLAVVDPPYNVGAANGSFGGKASAPSRVGGKTGAKNYANHNKTPDEDYFKELFRISKHQIIWGSNYYPQYLCHSGAIVWDKLTTGPLSDCEIAFQSFNKLVYKFTNAWSGFNKGGDTSERVHPNQKPIKLYDWTYKQFLPQGGKVIDTHLGSGSNRIAANKAGNIDFVGFELDKDYYEAQEKRWKGFISQTRLF